MILLVDDNQENIFSLKTLLEIHKFDVDTASSGEEALKKILKTQYSLIILDVQMPDMDGFEVAEAISGYSKSKDVPIIFLSAVSTSKKFITKGYASGGIDYVTKPFDPDLLLLKIRTFYKLSEQTQKLNEMEQFLRAEIEFRKRAERKLQEHVEELRSVLESLPQIAFTTSKEGHIEFVNHNWFAYSLSMESMPDTQGISVRECITSAIKSKKRFIAEVRIRKSNEDEYRYHVLYLTPVVKETEIEKWVGIFTDIHNEKMSAQLLEKKVEERTEALSLVNKRLEESNNELRQFAFIASHDLQEPLRKIQTFSNLVLTRYTPEDEKGVSYLHKIVDSAERLRRLVTDLLMYSSLQTDEVFLPTDMKLIVEGVLSDLELVIKSKNATVMVDELPSLEVMPFQMQQVFLNLVSNALKFTREGVKPQITITATLVDHLSIDSPASDIGNYCRISVRDNGIGFNDSYATKIFEIFQRLNTKDKFEGTGIGLALVKKVIDKHNGIIAAKSVEDEGTCFSIVIPVSQHIKVASMIVQSQHTI